MEKDGSSKTVDSSPSHQTKYHARRISVYDAVAGRAGRNGFLTQEQLKSDNIVPLSADEVLLRSTKSSRHLPPSVEDSTPNQPRDGTLPESDLLTAIHTYASDFYGAVSQDGGRHDFRSLDETALIAMGIFLEEAVREVLGETGDMVLIESDSLLDGLPETEMNKHQVQGKVEIPEESESDSSSDTASDQEEEEQPARKRRR